MATCDASTLSRIESTGARPVALLDALERAWVEITDDGLKLTKKRRSMFSWSDGVCATRLEGTNPVKIG